MAETIRSERTSPRRELLCVDDDPNTLKLRKLVLEAAGYSVHTANSGESALRALAQGKAADLVLLDYLMPEMNGTELATRLREQYPHMPLIAVSAIGQLPESLLNLVDAHFMKGQSPDLLLSTISGILDQLHEKDVSKQRLPKATVLCVDDEELQLKVRRMLFESAGYVVLEAQGAETALEKFRTEKVDAVLMDYSLFGQNGTAIAKQMKLLRPNVPVVILSGSASSQEGSSDVDLWLRKMDIEPEELVNEVGRLIEQRNDGKVAESLDNEQAFG
ncbi:MAG TPA: response regulator [Terriglobales bacterium]|nr:response regulator [Terriglobales bacterium]